MGEFSEDDEQVFDDPIDRAPQAHAFYDTPVDWVAIDEKLPIARG